MNDVISLHEYKDNLINKKFKTILSETLKEVTQEQLKELKLLSEKTERQMRAIRKSESLGHFEFYKLPPKKLKRYERLRHLNFFTKSLIVKNATHSDIFRGNI